MKKIKSKVEMIKKSIGKCIGKVGLTPKDVSTIIKVVSIVVGGIRIYIRFLLE